MNCVFCSPEKSFALRHWRLMWDKYPVSEAHLLIVPIRHMTRLLEVSPEEWSELQRVITIAQGIGLLHGADGFNIGINEGEAAGQTIEHLHIHVIPRYKGDCENPRGGVRKVKKPLVDY